MKDAVWTEFEEDPPPELEDRIKDRLRESVREEFEEKIGDIKGDVDAAEGYIEEVLSALGEGSDKPETGTAQVRALLRKAVRELKRAIER